MSSAAYQVECSLVLPAYREADNLRLMLPRIHAALRDCGLGDSSEILVIDTMESLDSTQQVCEQFNVRHLRRRPSNNYGDAVRLGIQEAQGKWVVFMDADGSHEPESIAKLVAERETHDVVIASRYVSGGSTENTFVLRVMSRILNTVYSVVLDLPVKDVSNSFKLYRADLLKQLELRCQNFDIIEEILFKLRRRNPQLRIREVPFTFKSRQFGRTKRNLFLFMLTYVWTILRLRFAN